MQYERYTETYNEEAEDPADRHKYHFKVKCRLCKETKSITVRGEDLHAYQSGDRRMIQDIFPYLQPWEREMLFMASGGICDPCYKSSTQED